MIDTSKDNLAPKVAKAKPLKALPTARLMFEKQLGIIRAYAAASTNERKPVSNADVAKIAEVDPNTVSLCNPFLREIQLITREGHNHRPSDAAIDYFQAWKWNQETAAIKLRPVIESSWFAAVLSPRLDFRAMSKAEAMQALAEEIKAPKEFEVNLSLLLDYLKVAGVIIMENGTIHIGKKSDDAPPQTQPQVLVDHNQKNDNLPPQSNSTKQFSIPIPDKADAIITVPSNIDAEDWEMLGEMIQTYIKRWKGFSKPSSNAANTNNENS